MFPIRTREMAQQKSIVIIEDHPLFREGLKAIIRRDASYQVVGEAESGRKGLQMVRELKPDLTLVDISLPDQSGTRLAQEIHSLLPETRMMIVSMHNKIDYIIEAFKAGVTGYMVKESASDRLLQGLEAVAKGEYFMDSFISDEVVESLIELPVKKAKGSDASYETLTPREQEIMRLLADGVSVKEIAEKLFISPRTVENHRANIMNKLNLNSIIELARYAARLGLIDVELWKD